MSLPFDLRELILFVVCVLQIISSYVYGMINKFLGESNVFGRNFYRKSDTIIE